MGYPGDTVDLIDYLIVESYLLERAFTFITLPPSIKMMLVVRFILGPILYILQYGTNDS